MKHQKVQSETAKGAPERPEVLPKRSTSKSNRRAQMKHQKVQSEITKGAPERPEVLPKRSTSKSNRRAQMKHQKVQSETTKGAPERPEVLPKRSTSKSNQRAQMKHQKVQSESTKGAPENQQDAAEFIHRIVMVHLFRNWKISGHNVISYVRSILSQRWVGGPLCIFHTSKRVMGVRFF